MNEKNKLIEYFKNGYFINGPILKISEIKGIKTPNNSLKEKTLIMLLREGGNSIKIVTDDKETIKLAKQKREDQDTPISTVIYVFCEVSGTNVAGEGVSNLRSFVHALNENSNWKFKSDIDNNLMFTIEIEIESVDVQVINEQIELVQHFIDLLAYYQNIGIFIHEIKNFLIPKFGPVLTVWPIKKRLEKPPNELISKIVDRHAYSGKKELFDAAHGLNLSYVENCLPNRVSMLWATVETLFGNNPEHLLKAEEIETLIKCIDQLDIWKSENDKNRLKTLKERIKDPTALSLKTRNERIALSVSNELDLNYAKTLKNIRFVSKVRGKNLHDLRLEKQRELIEAEGYLQGILKAYINKKLE